MEANIYMLLIVFNFIGNVFCINKEMECEPVYDSADKIFKRAIEYTRWRMATRTASNLVFKREDDELDIAVKPTLNIKATDYTHDTENVIIADALPKSTAAVQVIDGTTKEYTRFVIPKSSESSEEIYPDLGLRSSIQGSGTSSTPIPTMEGNAGEYTTEIQDVIGVNQNALSGEVQSREIAFPVPLEVAQVAPLAPSTTSRVPTELPLKPELFERKAFLPFKKPLRTDSPTDIFVPTRMYITSITEDFGDFLSISPDQEKKFILSTEEPIQPLHQTIQVDFPHLTRTTYIDDLETISIRREFLKRTDYNNKVTFKQIDVKNIVEENNIFLTRSTTHTTDLTDFKDNNEARTDETTTDNDYVEVKPSKDIRNFQISTIFDRNHYPTRTYSRTSQTVTYKETSTTESDYTLPKDSNNYHKENEIEEKKDSPSRLEQFYDNIYMKYEEPKGQVHIPKKSIILEKSDYEEEENEPIPPKSSLMFTEAPEIDRRVSEPTLTVIPYTRSHSIPVHNTDEGEEEEDSEEEDNSIDKIKEKVAYIETTENLTNLFQLTTVKAKSVVDQSRFDVYAPSEGVCSLVKLSPLNFKTTRNLYEINIQLQMWSQRSMVKIIDITKGNLTYMENSINMVVIDDDSNNDNKKETIMIISGIYGRDHIAVSSVMYILYQLIEKSQDQNHLLAKYRFLIVPVLNPDGYHYSTTFPKQKHWMKNLHQYYEECIVKECESCFLRGTHCKLKTCYGVNLDRNFAYQWLPLKEATADHVCGMFYAGQSALSEPESQALAKYLKDDNNKLSAFFSLKEGDVLGIMFPYSNTKNMRTFGGVYKHNAYRAASAAFAINSRPYVAGQMSEFLPLYSGGLEDWVEHHLGIENVYTIMMSRPSDANSSITMERIDHEAFAALNSLLMKPESSPPSMQLKHHVESSAKQNKALSNIYLACIFLWR